MYNKIIGLLTLLLVLTIIDCTINKNYIVPAPLPPKNIVINNTPDDLKDATVVILFEDKTLGITLFESLCAGVWVGDNTILTAAHCVSGNIVKFDTRKDAKDYTLLLTATTGIVLKINRDHDLALIASADDPGEHKFVTLASSVSVGDKVRLVSHVADYPYTYTEGIVSGMRYKKIPKAGLTRLIQISAPVWGGYSGGGGFDKDGKLIGICTFVSLMAPDIGFMIDTDEIKDFLGR